MENRNYLKEAYVLLLSGLAEYYLGNEKEIIIRDDECGMETVEIIDENNCIVRTYLLYETPDNKFFDLCEIIPIKNNKINGIVIKYGYDGKPIEEIEYKNGKINGLCRANNYQGILLFEAIYKNNKFIKFIYELEDYHNLVKDHIGIGFDPFEWVFDVKQPMCSNY